MSGAFREFQPIEQRSKASSGTDVPVDPASLQLLGVSSELLQLISRQTAAFTTQLPAGSAAGQATAARAPAQATAPPPEGTPLSNVSNTHHLGSRQDAGNKLAAFSAGSVGNFGSGDSQAGTVSPGGKRPTSKESAGSQAGTVGPGGKVPTPKGSLLLKGPLQKLNTGGGSGRAEGGVARRDDVKRDYKLLPNPVEEKKADVERRQSALHKMSEICRSKCARNDDYITASERARLAKKAGEERMAAALMGETAEESEAARERGIEVTLVPDLPPMPIAKPQPTGEAAATDGSPLAEDAGQVGAGDLKAEMAAMSDAMQEAADAGAGKVAGAPKEYPRPWQKHMRGTTPPPLLDSAVDAMQCSAGKVAGAPKEYPRPWRKHMRGTTPPPLLDSAVDAIRVPHMMELVFEGGPPGGAPGAAGGAAPSGARVSFPSGQCGREMDVEAKAQLKEFMERKHVEVGRKLKEEREAASLAVHKRVRVQKELMMQEREAAQHYAEEVDKPRPEWVDIDLAAAHEALARASSPSRPRPVRTSYLAEKARAQPDFDTVSVRHMPNLTTAALRAEARRSQRVRVVGMSPASVARWGEGELDEAASHSIRSGGMDDEEGFGELNEAASHSICSGGIDDEDGFAQERDDPAGRPKLQRRLGGIAGITSNSRSYTPAPSILALPPQRDRAKELNPRHAAMRECDLRTRELLGRLQEAQRTTHQRLRHAKQQQSYHRGSPASRAPPTKPHTHPYPKQPLTNDFGGPRSSSPTTEGALPPVFTFRVLSAELAAGMGEGGSGGGHMEREESNPNRAHVELPKAMPAWMPNMPSLTAPNPDPTNPNRAHAELHKAMPAWMPDMPSLAAPKPDVLALREIALALKQRIEAITEQANHVSPHTGTYHHRGMHGGSSQLHSEASKKARLTTGGDWADRDNRGDRDYRGGTAWQTTGNEWSDRVDQARLTTRDTISVPGGSTTPGPGAIRIPTAPSHVPRISLPSPRGGLHEGLVDDHIHRDGYDGYAGYEIDRASSSLGELGGLAVYQEGSSSSSSSSDDDGPARPMALGIDQLQAMLPYAEDPHASRSSVRRGQPYAEDPLASRSKGSRKHTTARNTCCGDDDADNALVLTPVSGAQGHVYVEGAAAGESARGGVQDGQRMYFNSTFFHSGSETSSPGQTCEEVVREYESRLDPLRLRPAKKALFFPTSSQALRAEGPAGADTGVGLLAKPTSGAALAAWADDTQSLPPPRKRKMAWGGKFAEPDADADGRGNGDPLSVINLLISGVVGGDGENFRPTFLHLPAPLVSAARTGGTAAILLVPSPLRKAPPGAQLSYQQTQSPPQPPVLAGPPLTQSLQGGTDRLFQHLDHPNQGGYGPGQGPGQGQDQGQSYLGSGRVYQPPHQGPGQGQDQGQSYLGSGRVYQSPPQVRYHPPSSMLNALTMNQIAAQDWHSWEQNFSLDSETTRERNFTLDSETARERNFSLDSETARERNFTLDSETARERQGNPNWQNSPGLGSYPGRFGHQDVKALPGAGPALPDVGEGRDAAKRAVADTASAVPQMLTHEDEHQQHHGQQQVPLSVQELQRRSPPRDFMLGVDDREDYNARRMRSTEGARESHADQRASHMNDAADPPVVLASHVKDAADPPVGKPKLAPSELERQMQESLRKFEEIDHMERELLQMEQSRAVAAIQQEAQRIATKLDQTVQQQQLQVQAQQTLLDQAAHLQALEDNVKTLHEQEARLQALADSVKAELRTESLGQLKDISSLFMTQLKSNKIAHAEAQTVAETRTETGVQAGSSVSVVQGRGPEGSTVAVGQGGGPEGSTLAVGQAPLPTPPNTSQFLSIHTHSSQSSLAHKSAYQPSPRPTKRRQRAGGPRTPPQSSPRPTKLRPTHPEATKRRPTSQPPKSHKRRPRPIGHTKCRQRRPRPTKRSAQRNTEANARRPTPSQGPSNAAQSSDSHELRQLLPIAHALRQLLPNAHNAAPTPPARPTKARPNAARGPRTRPTQPGAQRSQPNAAQGPTKAGPTPPKAPKRRHNAARGPRNAPNAAPRPIEAAHTHKAHKRLHNDPEATHAAHNSANAHKSRPRSIPRAQASRQSRPRLHKTPPKCSQRPTHFRDSSILTEATTADGPSDPAYSSAITESIPYSEDFEGGGGERGTGSGSGSMVTESVAYTEDFDAPGGRRISRATDKSLDTESIAYTEDFDASSVHPGRLQPGMASSMATESVAYSEDFASPGRSHRRVSRGRLSLTVGSTVAESIVEEYEGSASPRSPRMGHPGQSVISESIGYPEDFESQAPLRHGPRHAETGSAIAESVGYSDDFDANGSPSRSVSIEDEAGVVDDSSQYSEDNSVPDEMEPSATAGDPYISKPMHKQLSLGRMTDVGTSGPHSIDESDLPEYVRQGRFDDAAAIGARPAGLHAYPPSTAAGATSSPSTAVIAQMGIMSSPGVGGAWDQGGEQVADDIVGGLSLGLMAMWEQVAETLWVGSRGKKVADDYCGGGLSQGLMAGLMARMDDEVGRLNARLDGLVSAAQVRVQQLNGAIQTEADPHKKAALMRTERILQMQFDAESQDLHRQIAAVKSDHARQQLQLHQLRQLALLASPAPRGAFPTLSLPTSLASGVQHASNTATPTRSALPGASPRQKTASVVSPVPLLLQRRRGSARRLSSLRTSSALSAVSDDIIEESIRDSYASSIPYDVEGSVIDEEDEYGYSEDDDFVGTSTIQTATQSRLDASMPRRTMASSGIISEEEIYSQSIISPRARRAATPTKQAHPPPQAPAFSIAAPRESTTDLSAVSDDLEVQMLALAETLDAKQREVVKVQRSEQHMKKEQAISAMQKQLVDLEKTLQEIKAQQQGRLAQPHSKPTMGQGASGSKGGELRAQSSNITDCNAITSRGSKGVELRAQSSNITGESRHQAPPVPTRSAAPTWCAFQAPTAPTGSTAPTWGARQAPPTPTRSTAPTWGAPQAPPAPTRSTAPTWGAHQAPPAPTRSTAPTWGAHQPPPAPTRSTAPTWGAPQPPPAPTRPQAYSYDDEFGTDEIPDEVSDSVAEEDPESVIDEEVSASDIQDSSIIDEDPGFATASASVSIQESGAMSSPRKGRPPSAGTQNQTRRRTSASSVASSGGVSYISDTQARVEALRREVEIKRKEAARMKMKAEEATLQRELNSLNATITDASKAIRAPPTPLASRPPLPRGPSAGPERKSTAESSADVSESMYSEDFDADPRSVGSESYSASIRDEASGSQSMRRRSHGGDRRAASSIISESMGHTVGDEGRFASMAEVDEEGGDGSYSSEGDQMRSYTRSISSSHDSAGSGPGPSRVNSLTRCLRLTTATAFSLKES
eukprot:gene16274-22454_t